MHPTGLAGLAQDEFVKTWSRELPRATVCFEDDFEACIAHLRLPIGHRQAIRTTNFLERMFGEERRRTKGIPHAFGEKAVMKLMYAALMRARRGWRNVIVTSFEVKQIETPRDHLRNEFEQGRAAAQERIPLANSQHAWDLTAQPDCNFQTTTIRTMATSSISRPSSAPGRRPTAIRCRSRWVGCPMRQ